MSVDTTSPAVRTPRPGTRPLQLEVLRSELVTPSFRRVTVGGPALAGFEPLGFDQWFRLFLPVAGQASVRFPTAGLEDWYPQWLAIPTTVRPVCRNYTVRAFRADPAELDIDFVVHRSAAGAIDGTAAGWAHAAQPGDRLALLDQGVMFDPHDGWDEFLLVVDEAGLPAVEGILASMDPAVKGRVVVEVPLTGDRRPLAASDAVSVEWVVREELGAARAVPGAAALERLRTGPLPGAGAYVLTVGESALPPGVRRHLVRSGHPKAQIRFSGFYKHGASA